MPDRDYGFATRISPVHVVVSGQPIFCQARISSFPGFTPGLCKCQEPCPVQVYEYEMLAESASQSVGSSLYARRIVQECQRWLATLPLRLPSCSGTAASV